MDRTGRVIVLMQGPYDSWGKKVNEVNAYDVLVATPHGEMVISL